MKTWKKVLIGIISVFIVMGVGIGYLFMKQMDDVKQLEISSIDISLVKNGTYEGQVETMLVKVKVSVDVKNHMIQDIKILEHINGLGSKAEKIVDDMKSKNTDDVDIIAGATVSSKIIQKAVNEALEKGL